MGWTLPFLSWECLSGIRAEAQRLMCVLCATSACWRDEEMVCPSMHFTGSQATAANIGLHSNYLLYILFTPSFQDQQIGVFLWMLMLLFISILKLICEALWTARPTTGSRKKQKSRLFNITLACFCLLWSQEVISQLPHMNSFRYHLSIWMKPKSPTLCKI